MELDAKKFGDAFTEVWEISPTAIELSTTDGRRVRITALKKILGGMIEGYYATYEEQVDVDLAGGDVPPAVELANEVATAPWSA